MNCTNFDMHEKAFQKPFTTKNCIYRYNFLSRSNKNYTHLNLIHDPTKSDIIKQKLFFGQIIVAKNFDLVLHLFNKAIENFDTS